MFSDRLNELMRQTGLTPVILAKQMACHRSYILRLRNGQRVPRADGPGGKKLLGALLSFAEAQGKREILAEFLHCGQEQLESALPSYLFENEAPPGEKKRKEKRPYRVFGKRLNAVMGMTGLSNIRLGKALQIDPSYVSRFRSGMRTPAGNPETAKRLGTILLQRILESHREKEAAILTGISESAFDDTEEILPLFCGWLFDAAQVQPEVVVQELVSSIRSYAPGFPNAGTIGVYRPVSFERIAFPAVLCGVAAYKNAVLQLFSDVLERRAENLYIYSDLPVDRTFHDEEFRRKWSDLLAACAQAGTEIVIVHNVERDLTDTAQTIRRWAPLYLSGKVHSYYCKKQAGERFFSTLLICPGIGSISSFSVSGASGDAIVCRCDDDSRILELQKAQFESLLEVSGQLVRSVRTVTAEKKEKIARNGFYVLGATLSMFSMPEKVLESVLARSHAPEQIKREAASAFSGAKELFNGAVRDGFVQECAPAVNLADNPAVSDLPGISLPYTEREFQAHLGHVRALCRENENYRFTPLYEVPFSGVQMLIAPKITALHPAGVLHSTVLFEHPALSAAFFEYAKRFAAESDERAGTRGDPFSGPERFL